MKVSVFDMPTMAKFHSSRHHYSGRRRFSGGVNVSLKVKIKIMIRKEFFAKNTFLF